MLLFWKSKRQREQELQRELDKYAAEIEVMIEIADVNEIRAFGECHRNEWEYWKARRNGLLDLRGKYIDHARGGSDYWLRALRQQLELYRRPRPYQGDALESDGPGNWYGPEDPPF
jgi:hypothetical protein